MIEIIKYKRVNKNKIIGYVDIKFPKWNNMIIRRIAHFQGDGGKRWFSLPSFGEDKPNGQVEYAKYWQFETEAHNTQLLEMLDEKVKAYCLENKIAEIEPLNLDMPIDYPAFEDAPWGTE